MTKNITKRDRLRRVVLLCAHFARNLAYYRAGHDRLTKTSPPFWRTVDGNFLDMAVLEWCKLFGDQNGKHFWGRVVADPARFKSDLLGDLGITGAQLTGYIGEMRDYRDKFLAHLDDLAVMDIPPLDQARAAVEFYHRHVALYEAAAGDLANLPTDPASYFKYCYDEATANYARSRT